MIDKVVVWFEQMIVLLAVAFKFLRNKVDAQDVVMNLFECLAQKLLKHDIQNFKSWLHATMRNECLMYIRKSKNYSFNLTIEQLEIKITADDSEEKNQTSRYFYA